MLIPGFALNPANIAGAVGLIKSIFGGGGDDASDIAMGMSEEQRALLAAILQRDEQYLPGLLEGIAEQADEPYEDPWERALWQRTRGDIESGFRPGYASGLSELSRRHMLTEPSSVLGPYTASMDRARGGAVARAAMERMASRRSERQRARELLSRVLAEARGGGVQLAGAYNQPIRGMTELSQQATSPLDWLSGLTRLRELQQRGRGPGAGVGGAGDYASRFGRAISGPPGPTL